MKSFKWFKEKTLTGQLIPPSREGMSLIYLPIEGALLMFGGISNSRLNDLYLFDLSKIKKSTYLFILLRKRIKPMENSSNYW